MLAKDPPKTKRFAIRNLRKPFWSSDRPIGLKPFWSYSFRRLRVNNERMMGIMHSLMFIKKNHHSQKNNFLSHFLLFLFSQRNKEQNYSLLNLRMNNYLFSYYFIFYVFFISSFCFQNGHPFGSFLLAFFLFSQIQQYFMLKKKHVQLTKKKERDVYIFFKKNVCV